MQFVLFVHAWNAHDRKHVSQKPSVCSTHSGQCSHSGSWSRGNIVTGRCLVEQVSFLKPTLVYFSSMCSVAYHT